jgi:hypothetical protein
MAKNYKNEVSSNQIIRKAQKKQEVSHFWAGLRQAKPDFLRFGLFNLNTREQIRFWEDTWLGNYSFQQQYVSVFFAPVRTGWSRSCIPVQRWSCELQRTL